MKVLENGRQVGIMTTGERLRALRLERGLSIEEAAHELGLSFSGLAMYERGERTPPTDKLKMLAAFYNTTVAYLLGETEVRDPAVLKELALHHIDRRNDPDAPISDRLAKRIRELQEELGRLADQIAEERKKRK